MNYNEPPIMASPLTSMASALRSLSSRQRELDRRDLATDDEAERNLIRQWLENNMRAIDHLQQAMAAVPATGAEEAVVQVLIALERITLLRDDVEDTAVDDQLKVIQLLLRWSLPMLAERTGIDLALYGAERYREDSRSARFFTDQTGPAPDAAGTVPV
jgi:hypothetical protein